MGRWMNPDRWTAVVCLAISALLIVALPSQTSDRPLPGVRGFEVLDGAFFPKIAIALFIIASVWLIIEARPRRADSAPDTDVEAGTPAPFPEGKEALPLLPEHTLPGMTARDALFAAGLSGGLLIYVQVLEFAGYLFSSIIGVCLLAVVCGQRSLVGLFFGGVVFPTIVYFLFSRLFLVPLPRGSLWLG